MGDRGHLTKALDLQYGRMTEVNAGPAGDHWGVLDESN